ncbi:MAG: primosomal protein N' [candidate division KSB1 bacterium]|nr:primosomal protein N' [candidate division KSB1 bacterium]
MERDASTELYAEVAIPGQLDQLFTYSVPSALTERIRLGQRVLVPFGRRQVTGLVIRLVSATQLPPEKLRPILDVLDLLPSLTPDLIDLCLWMRDYYLCTLGEAIATALPAGMLHRTRIMCEPLRAPTDGEWEELRRGAPLQAQILETLLAGRVRSATLLAKRFAGQSVYSALSRLADKGWVRVSVELGGRRSSPRTERLVELHPHLRTNGTFRELIRTIEKRAPKQAEVLAILAEQEGAVPVRTLLSYAKTGTETLVRLQKKGWIRFRKQAVFRDPYAGLPIEPASEVRLTEEQENAVRQVVEAIEKGGYAAFLLHGVTGSGKTQVYIEALKKVREKGKAAIVLVPEIALTPQMVQRFRAHFGDEVAVLHSRLSEGERFDAWQLLRSGKKTIALGPRSALFAPLENLGLIVVDEEPEISYKQMESAPRFHARDTAIMRAYMTRSVVLLGSATPSVESYYNAKTGKYTLLELTRRVDEIPMPKVELVNMTKEPRPEGKMPVFSRLLKQKIEEKLQAGEQIILLQNRRGYAPLLVCKECGFVETCRNCHISLTYHLAGHRLRCHYCNYSQTAPETCPKCGGINLVYKGRGTQRVEQEIQALFPHARVVRMDLDTTVRKWSHDRILSAFGRGEYDILLGTQMVAKGLDFPNVTLVGVVTADFGLFFPDFRAPERTFQLLTQVAGRAGRKGKQGEVIIQTFSPWHFALVCASRHDYRSFYEREIHDRYPLGYPPFGRLVAVHFRGRSAEETSRLARHFGSELRTRARNFTVVGPSPSPLSRIRGLYRWQLLARQLRRVDPTGAEMRTAIKAVYDELQEEARRKHITIVIDVDPVSLM